MVDDDSRLHNNISSVGNVYTYAGNTATVIVSTAYSAVQYRTVQYSTVQYSTVQYSTVQNSTVQYSTVQYSTGAELLGRCPYVACL